MPPQSPTPSPIAKKVATLRRIRAKVKDSATAKYLSEKIAGFERKLSAGVSKGFDALTTPTPTPKVGEESPKSDFGWTLRANQSRRPITK